MMAGCALGSFNSLREAAESFVSYGQPVCPDFKYKEVYLEKYERYKAVRNCTLGLFC